MALLSPGVEVKEIDRSLTVPTAGSSFAAYAGQFTKGPADQAVLITSLQMFQDTFGKPTNQNYNDFFQVKSFLDYSNTIYVARGIDRDGFGAKEVTTATIAVDANISDETVEVSDASIFFEGEKISFATDTTVYRIDSINTTDNIITLAPSLSSAFTQGSAIYKCNPSANACVDIVKSGSTAVITEDMILPTVPTIANFAEFESVFDSIQSAHSDVSLKFLAKDFGTLGNSLSVILASSTEFTATAEVMSGINLAGLFEYGPQNANQYAVMVYDAVSDTIVEKFIVSVDPDEKDYNGKTLYIEEVINRQSTYINVKHTVGTKPETALVSNTCRKYDLAYGADGSIGKSEIIEQFDLNFADKETIEIDIVIIPEIAHLEIAAFCKTRADVIGYYGARFEDVVGIKPTVAVNNLVKYVTETVNIDNKYVAFGGNYIYVYDKWSDKNRWINIAGSLAGLRAQTNNARDVWFSEAGLNSGQLKNVIKLAQNFNNGQRDLLYQKSINSIVSLPGQGIVLWGQKVMTQKPSAFSRVNVRCLFNYMERQISKMAKYNLFEQNTETTRNLFVSTIKPFFERIQAGQGIEAFYIQCDESNNTPIVRQNNQFVASMYVKPTYTIEFITLNFVAVGASISFSEVVGQI